MRKRALTALAALLLLLAGMALGGAAALRWRFAQAPPAAPPIPTAAPAPPASGPPTPAPSSGRPEGNPAVSAEPDAAGRLMITAERSGYQSGELQLVIPKLGVDVPVLDGVDAQTLLRGVGLYDYAQLPGGGDRNVSIAGHRNGLKNGRITDRMPFYYINTLTEGDYLYLRDQAHIYQYCWTLTQVIAPDDWGPIRTQGGPCLTLTTCTPIGVADHRLVVRGELTEILPYRPDYPYPSHTSQEVS